MEGLDLDTPRRKRPRSKTPSSSSSRRVNKRIREDSPQSPSPQASRARINGEHDAAEAIPNSPIAERQLQGTSVSFAPVPPQTPSATINDPFAQLNLRSSVQKKVISTPLPSKGSGDVLKSVKKNARKTPGSARKNKPHAFRIKSSAGSLIDHPLNVVPVTTLSRGFLPLSWLVGSMPRIFSAEKRVGVPSVITGQIVMIARIEGEKNMVAIEKIGESLYAICSLKKDLKVKEIRTMSKMSKDANHAARTRTNQETMQIDGEEWWRGLSTDESNAEINGEVNLQFLVEEPATTEFSPDSNLTNARCTTAHSISPEIPSEEAFSRHDSESSGDSGYFSCSISSPQRTQSQPVNPIRLQYVEALYVRKTSLAYFTKSALSRARAEAKHLPGQSSLIPLLQALLLQDEDFNTKYETYLPSLLVADLQNPPSSFLLQEELPHLTKRFGSGGDDEMRTRLLEIEIKELKVRETQLQIILLSELLALDEESHGIENGLDDTERDDYETLLATHLDRLSIMAMLENSDDISEQFMREILLPFYSSRLPRILEIVGGPLDFVSPVKQQQPKKSQKTRKPILTPRTLSRISRPRRDDLSPTPFPIIPPPRKTFKSTPKKQKISKSAGVLKRLQKTEVNIVKAPEKTKVAKVVGVSEKKGNAFGGKKSALFASVSVDDGAEVQVPATPAPRKTFA